MALVFQPHDIIWVKALSHSMQHEYRVAFGYETWEEGTLPVPCLKVQMAVNKKVLGRQAPSYTTQEEYKEVQAALQLLYAKHKHQLPVKHEAKKEAAQVQQDSP